MDKPLLEKSGRIQWGFNVSLSYSFLGNSIPFINGRILFFNDSIEFKETLTTKKLKISDIDLVEVNSSNTFWFSHHGDTVRFISFTAMKKDRQEIIELLRKNNVEVQEDTKLSPFLSLR